MEVEALKRPEELLFVEDRQTKHLKRTLKYWEYGGGR